MIKYKVVAGINGLQELEKKVEQMIKEGWKPLGGIAFNQGFCYQAMAGKIKEEKIDDKNQKVTKNLTANQGMKRLDELT